MDTSTQNRASTIEDVVEQIAQWGATADTLTVPSAELRRTLTAWHDALPNAADGEPQFEAARNCGL